MPRKPLNYVERGGGYQFEIDFYNCTVSAIGVFGGERFNIKRSNESRLWNFVLEYITTQWGKEFFDKVIKKETRTGMTTHRELENSRGFVVVETNIPSPFEN
jgi:hypothetical protein